MSKTHISIVVLIVAIVTTPALAAPAKKKVSDTNSIRANCLKQVGAYYHPAEGRWYYAATGRGSPQEQAFYACLDAHTMKR